MMKDEEREIEKETEEKNVEGGKERRDQNKDKIQNIVYQSQKRVRMCKNKDFERGRKRRNQRRTTTTKGLGRRKRLSHK